jgi:hypothetical protein
VSINRECSNPLCIRLPEVCVYVDQDRQLEWRYHLAITGQNVTYIEPKDDDVIEVMVHLVASRTQVYTKTRVGDWVWMVSFRDPIDAIIHIAPYADAVQCDMTVTAVTVEHILAGIT